MAKSSSMRPANPSNGDCIPILPTTKIPLDPGTYTFVLRVGGQVVMSDSFVIQSPPNTFVLFFSILNDGPVGYVVDKQGVRRTPMGPTLELQVAPGHRIILQTDQPRFSFLFDCGASPKTFTPCHFVADTPAGLLPRFAKSPTAPHTSISRGRQLAGHALVFLRNAILRSVLHPTWRLIKRRTWDTMERIKRFIIGEPEDH